MRTVAMMMLLGMFVVGGLVGIPDSSASEFQSQCIQDAIATRVECKALCQENFQMDKDECWDVPHECAETCRSARETCVDEALDDLDVCLIPCSDTLAAAKEDCRGLYPLGSQDLDRCIDAAQLTAFICRDDCRESIHLAAELKSCRKTFRVCIKACMNP